ncbi:MAG: DUF5522 domain-containing protein [Bacteroidota bacterium]|nr:DUF5522 domain-containing protein [Bacteroidota bacterium]MDP4216842.1 DUF5522 domain-containing protein [Bacteroidota bacterium]MDP4244827.1 DUF5522 domain-containing protein [Bacteroidota bacterium]MDP4255070.1 DUF5522 domain-containing protein [Bacteroidota bacterium]MDP4260528.1 DUF5522 domain-containing protein [Bacteroidota bacterium]
MPQLIEGEDFYLTGQGLMVFTEKYHLARGTCCGSGCRHCPYHYSAVPEPRRSELREQKKSDGNSKK